MQSMSPRCRISLSPHPVLRSGRRLPLAVLLAVLACGLAGCTQQMANQPKYTPLEPSSFFPDGRSARPLVPGTVPRGTLARDALAIPPNSNVFPIPVTPALLERGRQRFAIFCSPCHGLLGDGNGIVAMRGVRHPPSYFIDRLRNAPVGHFYDVISNGFGAMQDYAAQVPPHDRLAIIAYIRALQLSQHAPVSEISAADRQKLIGQGSAATPVNQEGTSQTK
jgi:mono/diheme cytochrome c family protein